MGLARLLPLFVAQEVDDMALPHLTDRDLRVGADRRCFFMRGIRGIEDARLFSDHFSRGG